MKKHLTLLTLALSLAASGAHADDHDQVQALHDTTVSLLKAMVEKGVLTQEQADAMLKQAEVPKDSTDGKPPVRVTYVPETVKNEMRDQIKQDVLAQAKSERWGDPGTLPDWLSRILWEGDMRLRLQENLYPRNGDAGNAPPATFIGQGQNVSNTQIPHDFLALRLRLGMLARISDSLKVGVRLTSGSTGTGTSPVSTNQTLGTYDSRYTLGIDRAFMTYQGRADLVLTGGRIANPFVAPTDLVWSENLNFEGLAAKYTPTLTHSTRGFLTVGAFPIQDLATSDASLAKSKWLYGFQSGADWTLSGDSIGHFQVALFDYQHVEGIPDQQGQSLYAGTAPAYRQQGNSVFAQNGASSPSTSSTIWALSSKFRELNLSTNYDLGYFDPTHILLDFDYVRNLAFNRTEILQRTGVAELGGDGNIGYQFKLTVGNPRVQKHGDWQAYVGYRYLESDAVIDAFTDSDFHSGGTNARGFFLGGRYGLDKNTFASLRWMSSEAITGPQLNIDTLQFDINTAF